MGDTTVGEAVVQRVLSSLWYYHTSEIRDNGLQLSYRWGFC